MTNKFIHQNNKNEYQKMFNLMDVNNNKFLYHIKN